MKIKHSVKQQKSDTVHHMTPEALESHLTVFSSKSRKWHNGIKLLRETLKRQSSSHNMALHALDKNIYSHTYFEIFLKNIFCSNNIFFIKIHLNNHAKTKDLQDFFKKECCQRQPDGWVS